MMHSPILPAPITPPADEAPRLRPASYLRLRRQAAGLSVEDVAVLLAPRAADRGAARAFVRLLETDLMVARKARPIERLATCYPLDPAVYYQLAGPAPHPRVCRGCGCSEWNLCQHEERGACSLASPTRCSHCATPAAGPRA
jgi:hypothetical protein